MIEQTLQSFIDSGAGQIVLAILALDTVRAVLAFTGWIPRSWKVIGRMIYGKYDEEVMIRALQGLGYPDMAAEKENRKLKAHIAKIKGTTSVTKDNAPIYLVLLLAKYCSYFENNVSYGGDSFSESRYYLNTMEAVHESSDLKTMCDIMIMLLNSAREKKPDVIIVPKGGNPLFGAKVAENLNRPVIFAKGKKEKSKVKSSIIKEEFQINYEGSRNLYGMEHLQQSVILDCNLSSGSQLKAIVKDLNSLSRKITNIAKPKDVFVLFRVDDRHKDVAAAFLDLGVTLHRFFDLDEESKEKIYSIKQNAENHGREVNPEYREDWEKAEEVLEFLKQKNKLYYQKAKRNSFSIFRNAGAKVPELRKL